MRRGGPDEFVAVRDLLDGRRPDEVAEIRATVDLERALGELGEPAERVADARADDLLGARVVVLDVGGRQVALAEPTTEGRLAATLARHGEGRAGAYLGLPFSEVAEIATRAAEVGIRVSRVGLGPFGPEVVVLGGRIGDSVTILVPTAGTIAGDDRAPPDHPARRRTG